MPTTLEQLQYGFDRDSRRTWRQRATTQGWDNAYVYDSLSQVIGDDCGDLNQARNAIAGIPSNGSRWQYDQTGNWHGYQTLANGVASLSQARTHDKGNRLMEVGDAATMRTDRAGRMLETVPGPGGDWNKGYRITWDAWSRIVSVASVEGETITPVASYGYDGLTRRITRYTNAEGVTLNSYYNDAWRPVEERKNSETTASASYLWGARHRDDLVRRDRAVGSSTLNETRYILMDYFSPASITDESGDVTERYQFSAFGLRTILNPDFTVRSDSECGMEFAFQGQFEDAETNWLNYGYRYYLPALGRWSCKDPIGERGGLNLYGMTDNNPFNSIDFFGLAADNCYYIWIPILVPPGEKQARPAHAAMGHRPSGSTEPVTIFGTDMDGNWKDEGTYDPKTGKYDGGKQGKLYECCCLSDEEYKRLKDRISALRAGKVPEGSNGAGGNLPNNDLIPFNSSSPTGVPYNCATCTSMATSGLGGVPTSNTWNKKPSEVYPEGGAGLSDFWKTVMEQYKQMEAAVKASKCSVKHNGVPEGNPY